MTGKETEIVDTGNLKKDPAEMYSDLPIDQYHDLKSDTLDDLYDRLDRMTDQDVEADANPTFDDPFETHDPRRESYKKAVEDEIKKREATGEKRSKGCV